MISVLASTSGRCCRLCVVTLVAGGLLVSGCSSAPDAQVASSEVEAAVDCAALGELACLDAAQCTLHQGEDKAYFCAPAANECERGFPQRSGRIEDCPEGCAYTPAQCYCAPDVTCVCGGGPPALCTAAS